MFSYDTLSGFLHITKCDRIVTLGSYKVFSTVLYNCIFFTFQEDILINYCVTVDLPKTMKEVQESEQVENEN